jgi:hypothetical protein
VHILETISEMLSVGHLLGILELIITLLRKHGLKDVLARFFVELENLLSDDCTHLFGREVVHKGPRGESGVSILRTDTSVWILAYTGPALSEGELLKLGWVLDFQSFGRITC